MGQVSLRDGIKGHEGTASPTGYHPEQSGPVSSSSHLPSLPTSLPEGSVTLLPTNIYLQGTHDVPAPQDTKVAQEPADGSAS